MKLILIYTCGLSSFIPSHSHRFAILFRGEFFVDSIANEEEEDLCHFSLIRNWYLSDTVSSFIPPVILNAVFCHNNLNTVEAAGSEMTKIREKV